MAKKKVKRITKSIATPEGLAKRLKNLKPGRGFKDHPENINRNGRPPKLLNDITAELLKSGYKRVSPAMVTEAYELLLNLSESDLRSKSIDKDAPIIVRVVAKAMLEDGRGFEIIERMIDRAHGKATQSTELGIVGGGAVIRITKGK